VVVKEGRLVRRLHDVAIAKSLVIISEPVGRLERNLIN
jgi:hypothetical protein